MKIKLIRTPPAVEVYLSDRVATSEMRCDVIADVNSQGNWIKGLELLGPGEKVSLGKALLPLVCGGLESTSDDVIVRFKVTYDEIADAGYIYLPYKMSADARKAIDADPQLTKSSYQIEDESAILGLIEDASLAYVRFRIPVNEHLDSFVMFFDVQE